jgi:hypothetical protein
MPNCCWPFDVATCAATDDAVESSTAIIASFFMVRCLHCPTSAVYSNRNAGGSRIGPGTRYLSVFEEATAAKLFTRDEACRIAANIAKLPEPCCVGHGPLSTPFRYDLNSGHFAALR